MRDHRWEELLAHGWHAGARMIDQHFWRGVGFATLWVLAMVGMTTLWHWFFVLLDLARHGCKEPLA
jgi:hypothetical protein